MKKLAIRAICVGHLVNYPDGIADVASTEHARVGHAEPAVSRHRRSVVGAVPLWPGTQQRVLLSPAFSLSLQQLEHNRRSREYLCTARSGSERTKDCTVQVYIHICAPMHAC
jgi:hypothetical protein